MPGTTEPTTTTTEPASTTTDTAPGLRYLRPGWFTRHLFNPLVRWLVRLGVGVKGARELRVAGRATGIPRTAVVNLLEVDGHRFLVAPRGETEWVRNLRAAGVGELRLGRSVTRFWAGELADGEKTPVLRAYLRAWAWEVAQFFDGLDAGSPDAALAAAAPGFPVFAITEA